MKRFQTETQTTIAKVNVTPIIDVALVLVIILMITAPMIAVSNVDVKLPEALTRNLEGHDRIRADQSVAYSAVRQIVEAARAAGAARIAVGTTQKGNAPQGASL